MVLTSASSVSYSCVSVSSKLRFASADASIIALIRATFAARFASKEVICSAIDFDILFPLDCEPVTPGVFELK